jgi:hypothetical protein
VKVMNQTNQMKTRNRNAFPRSEPNFFTATIYPHERKNAILTVSHAHSDSVDALIS